MSVPNGTDRTWRISSYSGQSGQCVEVALDGEREVGVRDSKARDSGQLALPAVAWTALLDQVRR